MVNFSPTVLGASYAMLSHQITLTVYSFLITLKFLFPILGDLVVNEFGMTDEHSKAGYFSGRKYSQFLGYITSAYYVGAILSFSCWRNKAKTYGKRYSLI
jgi:hypothetical protein